MTVIAGFTTAAPDAAVAGCRPHGRRDRTRRAIGDGVAGSVRAAGLPVGGLRRAGRGHRPPRGPRHGGRLSRPRWPGPPTSWWWPWSTTSRCTPCCPVPTGALAAGGPGTTFVVVSTITTECVRAIGAEAEAAGTSVVDCGVSGGPAAAAAGELICMVGGDEDVLERLAPLFDAIELADRPDGAVRYRARRQAGPQPRPVRRAGWPPTRARYWPRRPASSWRSWPR